MINDSGNQILDEKNQPGTAEMIRKTPDVLGGEACIGMRRIAVWMVVQLRQFGLGEDEIRKGYAPPLSADELDAAWKYYDAHREEIDRAIRENDED